MSSRNIGGTCHFLSRAPENIILTVVKKAEDSNDIILRFYETSGEDKKAVIRLTETLKGAKETDLLENETSEISIQEKTIKALISKHEIKTMKAIVRSQTNDQQISMHPPTTFI